MLFSIAGASGVFSQQSAQGDPDDAAFLIAGRPAAISLAGTGYAKFLMANNQR